MGREFEEFRFKIKKNKNWVQQQIKVSQLYSRSGSSFTFAGRQAWRTVKPFDSLQHQGRSRQGKGIMDEALKAILNFGFRQLFLRTLEAYTHRENQASQRLLLNNGFKLIAGKTDQHNADNQVFQIENASAHAERRSPA